MIGACDTVHLTRENSMLMELVRVLHAGQGLKSLKMTSLSMLTKSETQTAVYGSVDSLSYVPAPGLPKHDLWTLEQTRLHPGPALESVDITGKFQPDCFRQMLCLLELLRGAFSLRELRLNLFEYPTEKLARDLQEQFPTSLRTPLPLMLGMDPKPSEEELEGRRIGEMMVESLLGHNPLRIANGGSALEAMLQCILSSQPDCCTALASARCSTVGAVLPRDPHFTSMSFEQYDDVMQHLYATPLPEGLESLTMRVVLRGGKVQSRFLYLPYLKTLDLQYCEMDDAAFELIGPTIGRRMPSLERLTLCHNRLDRAELGLVIGQSLQELNFSHNPITSPSAAHLFRCLEYNQMLHLVDLSYTRITKEVSLTGLSLWMATPARLLIPECYSLDDLVSDVSRFVHDGVEVEMVGCESRVWAGDFIQ